MTVNIVSCDYIRIIIFITCVYECSATLPSHFLIPFYECKAMPDCLYSIFVYISVSPHVGMSAVRPCRLTLMSDYEDRDVPDCQLWSNSQTRLTATLPPGLHSTPQSYSTCIKILLYTSDNWLIALPTGFGHTLHACMSAAQPCHLNSNTSLQV